MLGDDDLDAGEDPSGCGDNAYNAGWAVGRSLLLTDQEHEVMDLLGQVAGKLHKIIRSGGDVSWPNDWNEAAYRIHAVQHMVMAQAAARAFPDRYRLLGGTVA